MIIPISAALLCSGTAPAIMVRAPFIKPDMPAPATTLPMINMFDEVATPHSSDPISNTPKKARKVNYRTEFSTRPAGPSSPSSPDFGPGQQHYRPCCRNMCTTFQKGAGVQRPPVGRRLHTSQRREENETGPLFSEWPRASSYQQSFPPQSPKYDAYSGDDGSVQQNKEANEGHACYD